MALKSVSQVTPSDSPDNGNGWIFVQDSYYTVNRPLIIPAGTRTNIPDDAEGVLSNRTYGPDSSANWYNPQTSSFHVDAMGDVFHYRFNFICEAQINNRSITVAFDIGTANAPFEETVVLARGAGVPVKQSITMPITAGAALFNNGGKIYLSSDTDLRVYKISIAIMKLFKGPSV